MPSAPNIRSSCVNVPVSEMWKDSFFSNGGAICSPRFDGFLSGMTTQEPALQTTASVFGLAPRCDDSLAAAPPTPALRRNLRCDALCCGASGSYALVPCSTRASDATYQTTYMLIPDDHAVAASAQA
eukprot:358534-Pleurochrysis_carterae.AAC.1